MFLYVVVPEPQDAEAVVLQIMRPPLVVVVLPCRIMRAAVELDDERKAAMVSNLLVVLCGNRDAQPIVNSGSLY